MTRDTDLIRRADAIAAASAFDAPVSDSDWNNAQAVAAQQIEAALRALPVQEPVRRTAELTDADYDRAIGILIRSQRASTSYLQRKMSLGYNAAAKLIELAEDDGIVSRPNDVGKREVLYRPVQEPPSPGVTAGAAGLGGCGYPCGYDCNGACFTTPAPVVPAEGLDPERLVMAWMAEQEGFATRGERFMETIVDGNDAAPWLYAACQVGIDAALRSAPPVGVWPDFIAPPKYENPCEDWEDPRLPDFRLIWGTARPLGYAIGLHGSMKRDCDLIAAPWVDNPAHPDDLIKALCVALNATQVGGVEAKPVGRIAVILQIDGYVKHIDLSIMPAPPVGARVIIPSGLIDALRSQRQIDADGCEVAVSRQACDEAADALEASATEIARLTARAEIAVAILAKIKETEK